MKCPIILEQKKSTDEVDEPRPPRSKMPSVQRLYNRFKPVGSRSLIIKNTTQKKNEQQSFTPPKPISNKGKGRQTVDDSIHNPQNTSSDETNKKLDKILNMLTKMQKDMSELEARISKLEKHEFNSDSTSIISTSNIPHKPASHDLVLNFNQKNVLASLTPHLTRTIPLPPTLSIPNFKHTWMNKMPLLVISTNNLKRQ